MYSCRQQRYLQVPLLVVLRVLSHMGVRAITARTFFCHQVSMLHTTITRVWTSRQQWMFASLQAEGDDLVCGGDGMADSPGHCAKYGTYTMMDLNHRAVIDVQLVQVVTCCTVRLNM